ncbi:MULTISPECIES: recombinase family protein [Klebsiella]|uniref:recombinase family protein n=1 Tax=Klebsiella TaxID=570 RepID=UPI001D0D27E6|nr:recombinase family protein [Klebsiella pneumoniae]MDT9788889.1 recombinase family protein [Klebsiella pneumoniae]MDT9880702.1 recombinase family protein [Klebsiella pneumoniae]MDZ5932403.1 recombinase family protein [Klebsiella pneumoniae]MDZ5947402.1 recombinase family protein [Klebsiella pneumoniae]MDZ5984596.1 recombinase family protein [Klebsiella pneumoniae]
MDRIGRNTIDLLQTVEALKEKGVSVVSMHEGFDLSTPAGEACLPSWQHWQKWNCLY